MKNLYTPDNVSELKPRQVFVFGSNLAGRHGMGAARTAALKFGAEYGVGVGPTGQCYAIPTKDKTLYTLPLDRIREHVSQFLKVAEANPALEYLVTEIGCGLAGHKVQNIAPMFLHTPANVRLPERFCRVIEIINSYKP